MCLEVNADIANRLTEESIGRRSVFPRINDEIAFNVLVYLGDSYALSVMQDRLKLPSSYYGARQSECRCMNLVRDFADNVIGSIWNKIRNSERTESPVAEGVALARADFDHEDMRYFLRAHPHQTVLPRQIVSALQRILDTGYKDAIQIVSECLTHDAISSCLGAAASSEPSVREQLRALLIRLPKEALSSNECLGGLFVGVDAAGLLASEGVFPPNREKESEGHFSLARYMFLHDRLIPGTNPYGPHPAIDGIDTEDFRAVRYFVAEWLRAGRLEMVDKYTLKYEKAFEMRHLGFQDAFREALETKDYPTLARCLMSGMMPPPMASNHWLVTLRRAKEVALKKRLRGEKEQRPAKADYQEAQRRESARETDEFTLRLLKTMLSKEPEPAAAPAVERKFAPISETEFRRKVAAAWSRHEDYSSEAESYQFDMALTSLTRQVENDLASSVHFDSENVSTETDHRSADACVVGYHTLDNGISFLGGRAGGDWEEPLVFIIYWDGKALRGYIPVEGNCWNTDIKAAFGNDEEADCMNIVRRRPGLLPGETLGRHPGNLAEFLKRNFDVMPTQILDDIKRNILPAG